MHALLAKMVELKQDGLGRVFSSLPTILPPPGFFRRWPFTPKLEFLTWVTQHFVQDF